jgi:hypothetical protein
MTDDDRREKPGEGTAPDDKGSECAERKTHRPSDDEIVSSGGSSTGAALRDKVGGVE